MPIGLLVLFALAVLVFFGLAQRVLDRMRLTDTQAIVIIALMIAGSYINLPLWGDSSVNVGGALVPLGLVVYLLYRAGTARERTRGIVSALVTALAVIIVSSLFAPAPHGGTSMLIDPLWLSGITAGIVGYLSGRSRRSAFVAGVGGLILADVYDLFRSPSPTALGGAGIFDQIVFAGVIAVGLAEIVGEGRERLQGGPELGEERPLALHQDEGTAEETESGQEESGDDGPGSEHQRES